MKLICLKTKMCKNIIENLFKRKRKFLVDVICVTKIKSPKTKLMRDQCSEAGLSILHRNQSNFAYLKVGRRNITLKLLGQKKCILKISLKIVHKVFVHSSKIIALCYATDNGETKCLILKDVLKNVETIKDIITSNVKNVY